MTKIDTVFDSMDRWRHLPGYQLERRADLFFALYMAQALEEKLGFPIHPQLIPEFPVRIGAIQPENNTNQSFKIDYLALSTDGRQAVFVELKTVDSSRRQKQDNYLTAAQTAGLTSLLAGVLDIFRASSSRRKYFYLLERLADLGLLNIPGTMRDIMLRPDLPGAAQASRAITIISEVSKCRIVYVQPHGQDCRSSPMMILEVWSANSKMNSLDSQNRSRNGPWLRLKSESAAHGRPMVK